MTPILCAGLAGLAAALLLGPTERAPSRPASPASATRADTDWLRRWRPWWCLLAAAGALAIVGGPPGAVLAPAAALGCWIVIGRAEPASIRRRRETARRELPHVVRLLSAALTAGADPADALATVVAALPGAAADRLAPVAARLRLGGDPVEAWRALVATPELAPLGRALARAQSTGVPVGAVVERLADELARSARAEAEDRARRVGVKAAVPLGVCLLPAFLLLGIVPVVGGLLTALRL